MRVGDIELSDLKVKPIISGFSLLDDNDILKEGEPELILVGAGTSHGKSAFMLQLCSQISEKAPVFFFSLEMSQKAIQRRLLSPRSGIPLKQIKHMDCRQSDLQKAQLEIQRLPLYVCCDGNKDINYIMQVCMEAANQYGKPAVIALDYLQLLYNGEDPNRAQEIAKILGTIKLLAKTLSCPLIMGSQLNRTEQVEGQKSAKKASDETYYPSIYNLKDSSSIENDADVILMLNRPYVYNENLRPNEADLIIAKNRDGEKHMSCVLNFRGEYCAFQDEVRRY